MYNFFSHDPKIFVDLDSFIFQILAEWVFSFSILNVSSQLFIHLTFSLDNLLEETFSLVDRCSILPSSLSRTRQTICIYNIILLYSKYKWIDTGICTCITFSWLGWGDTHKRYTVPNYCGVIRTAYHPIIIISYIFSLTFWILAGMHKLYGY